MTMELRDAINYFKKYLSTQQIADKLGVSAAQVYKYASGETATCKDSVVDAFYDNFKINNKPVVIDYYESEEQYLAIRRLRGKAK